MSDQNDHAGPALNTQHSALSTQSSVLLRAWPPEAQQDCQIERIDVTVLIRVETIAWLNLAPPT